jgi:hypothetical protein
MRQPGTRVRKAVTHLPDGTYCVSLTATPVHCEEPQLLHQEIDCRRNVTPAGVLALIKSG